MRCLPQHALQVMSAAWVKYLVTENELAEDDWGKEDGQDCASHRAVWLGPSLLLGLVFFPDLRQRHGILFTSCLGAQSSRCLPS